jgi:DNA end-binding protein Ku
LTIAGFGFAFGFGTSRLPAELSPIGGVKVVEPRANWKGFLKVGELTCAVALYTAASTSERIAFHTLNRETGHRVRRQFVDEETGKPVPSDEQVKGYEAAQGEYIMLEADEVASAMPESDKALAVEAFIRCNDIDEIYFDRPYYLAPADPVAEEAFALLRTGMLSKKVAALARTVLFRRVRTLLIRPHDRGLIGWTLSFDYEVRSAKEAFDGIAQMKIKAEMLDLAKHIIKTKRGEFDLREFDDRYESAVAELVRAKLEGKPIEARRPASAAKVVDLMEALRQSAHVEPGSKASAGKGRSRASNARNAKQTKSKSKAPAKTVRRRKAG